MSDVENFVSFINRELKSIGHRHLRRFEREDAVDYLDDEDPSRYGGDIRELARAFAVDIVERRGTESSTVDTQTKEKDHEALSLWWETKCLMTANMLRGWGSPKPPPGNGSVTQRKVWADNDQFGYAVAEYRKTYLSDGLIQESDIESWVTARIESKPKAVIAIEVDDYRVINDEWHDGADPPSSPELQDVAFRNPGQTVEVRGRFVQGAIKSRALVPQLHVALGKTVAVGRSDSLYDLWLLTNSISDGFHISPFHALRFVLCDAVPVVKVLEPLSLRTAQNGTWLTLSINTDVPPEYLAKRFIELRSRRRGQQRHRLPHLTNLRLLRWHQSEPHLSDRQLWELFSSRSDDELFPGHHDKLLGANLPEGKKRDWSISNFKAFQRLIQRVGKFVIYGTNQDR